MRVLITGGTGFIGSSLAGALMARGDEVLILSRQKQADSPGRAYCRQLSQLPDDEPVNAVVNLAGASLAAQRWSASYKREIVSSRLTTTRELLTFIQRLKIPPAALLSASAIGFYGHHGDERLNEDGAVSPGFSQQLCADWEALALQAASDATRVCLLRLGVVLDAGNGALVEMARSFRLGVGSWMGDGQQWLSWIHRQDAVAAILFLLDNPRQAGPFNLTAPQPVTGRDFSAELENHFRTLFSVGVPAPLARVLLGAMAEELLLNGQRVIPARLVDEGFQFTYPQLADALTAILQ